MLFTKFSCATLRFCYILLPSFPPIPGIGKISNLLFAISQSKGAANALQISQQVGRVSRVREKEVAVSPKSKTGKTADGDLTKEDCGQVALVQQTAEGVDLFYLCENKKNPNIPH